MPAREPIPPVTRFLETALYVERLDRARDFYRELFGFEILVDDGDRIVAMAVGGAHVLLLFRAGASSAPIPVSGGTVPPHDATGRQHVALAIPADALEAWERRLAERGIAIEGRVRAPRGGTSIYFRDPDGHLLELATPGLWMIY